MTKRGRKNTNDKNVTNVVQHKNLEWEHSVLVSINQVRRSQAINNKNESQKRENEKMSLQVGLSR